MPKLAAQLLFVALKTASPRRFLLRYPILIRKLQSLASMAGVLTKPYVVSSQGSWPKTYSDHRGSHPFCATTTCKSSSSSSSPRRSRFLGRKLVLERQNGVPSCKNFDAIHVAMTLTVGNALRWWTKGVHSNMKEIASADDLVNSLTRAGDNLVIVDFFSPGCGGCKFLHQKICQFAEKNPDVIFLQANYEEHKSMCYSLNVHVLPFFRFYRGAHGRLCSFSCTNATIKKFKDALAKHSTARCSLGPAKGLEESELLALAANRDLSFSYSKNEAAIESSSQVQLPMPSLSEFAPSEAVDMALAAVG